LAQYFRHPKKGMMSAVREVKDFLGCTIEITNKEAALFPAKD
jgi:hypothetical protein